MGTTIASLNVKLTGGISGSTSAMGSAGKVLGQFASQSAAVAAGMAVFELAKKGAEALYDLVKGEFEAIDATAKLSDTLGIQTEKLRGLEYAADLSGVSTETLTGGLTKMLNTIGQAAKGSDKATAALAAVGLSADQLSQMAPDEAFAKIGEALKGIDNPAQRAAATIGIFGKSGGALAPLLYEGADGINAMQAEAEKLGISLNRVDSAQVEAANDSFTKLGYLLKGVADQLAVAVAPFITYVNDKLLKLGTDGFSVAGHIQAGFEMLLRAVAYGADVFDGFKIVIKSLQLAFSWLVEKSLQGVKLLADGLAWVINASIDAINALIRTANKIPGIDISPIQSKVVVDEGLDAQIQGQIDLVGELGDEIKDLAKFDHVNKVSEFFKGIQDSSKQAAEKVAEDRKSLSHFGDGIEAPEIKPDKKSKKSTDFTPKFASLERRFTAGFTINAGTTAPMDKIAKATERTAKATEEIAKNSSDTGDDDDLADIDI